MKTLTNLIVALFAIMCLSSCDMGPRITNPRNDATIMLRKYKECKGTPDEMDWLEDFEEMMNMYMRRGDHEGATEFHSLVIKGL